MSRIWQDFIKKFIDYVKTTELNKKIFADMKAQMQITILTNLQLPTHRHAQTKLNMSRIWQDFIKKFIDYVKTTELNKKIFADMKAQMQITILTNLQLPTHTLNVHVRKYVWRKIVSVYIYTNKNLIKGRINHRIHFFIEKNALIP